MTLLCVSLSMQSRLNTCCVSCSLPRRIVIWSITVICIRTLSFSYLGKYRPNPNNGYQAPPWVPPRIPVPGTKRGFLSKSTTGLCRIPGTLSVPYSSSWIPQTVYHLETLSQSGKSYTERFSFRGNRQTLSTINHFQTQIKHIKHSVQTKWRLQ